MKAYPHLFLFSGSVEFQENKPLVARGASHPLATQTRRLRHGGMSLLSNKLSMPPKTATPSVSSDLGFVAWALGCCSMPFSPPQTPRMATACPAGTRWGDWTSARRPRRSWGRRRTWRGPELVLYVLVAPRSYEKTKDPAMFFLFFLV